MRSLRVGHWSAAGRVSLLQCIGRWFRREPDEKKKISVPFFLDTGGKSIEELTAFPISGDLSPPPDMASAEAGSDHDEPVVSNCLSRGQGARLDD